MSHGRRLLHIRTSPDDSPPGPYEVPSCSGEVVKRATNLRRDLSISLGRKIAGSRQLCVLGFGHAVVLRSSIDSRADALRSHGTPDVVKAITAIIRTVMRTSVASGGAMKATVNEAIVHSGIVSLRWNTRGISGLSRLLIESSARSGHSLWVRRAVFGEPLLAHPAEWRGVLAARRPHSWDGHDRDQHDDDSKGKQHGAFKPGRRRPSRECAELSRSALRRRMFGYERIHRESCQVLPIH